MGELRAVVILLALLVVAGGCTFERTLTAGNVTVHYSGDISEGQAGGVADFVGGQLGATGRTDVHVGKAGGVYNVVVTSPWRGPIQSGLFLVLAASKLSQDVFGGALVRLQLDSPDGTVLASEMSEYRYVEGGGFRVWYSGPDEGTARSVLDYLLNSRLDAPLDVIVEGGGGVYEVSLLGAGMSGEYARMVPDLEGLLDGLVVLRVLDGNGTELAEFDP